MTCDWGLLVLMLGTVGLTCFVWGYRLATKTYRGF